MALILAHIGGWLAKKLLLFILILLACVAVAWAWGKFDGIKATQEKVSQLDFEDTALEKRLGEVSIEASKVSRDLLVKREQLNQINAALEKISGFFYKIKNWRTWKDELEQEKRKKGKGQSAIATLENAAARFGASVQEITKRREEIQKDRAPLQERLNTHQAKMTVFQGNVKTAVVILVTVILTPIFWKVSMFWLWAPILGRSQPIILDPPNYESSAVDFVQSAPAISVELMTGEEMLLKERFLQSSTVNASKTTRYLLDFHFPFMSLAAGLFLLTRIRPKSEALDAPCKVTVSCQDNATEEIALVTLAPGIKLAIRPCFVAALVFPTGRIPRLQSRWIFNRAHAWLTLRFRYFIVEGPVKLAFNAQRGVQCEAVKPESISRRINSDLTVAFSSNLNYSPVRAETFLAYFRGANPLFDDLFRGHGCVLNQQVGGGGSPEKARKFWEQVFGGVGKAFGL